MRERGDIEKKSEDGRRKTEVGRKSQSQFSERKENSRSFPTYRTPGGRQSQFTAPTGRQVIAQGEALCLNVRTLSIAPRSNIIQGNEFAWGKTNNTRMANNKRTNEIKTKENIQYSTINIQCKSWHFIALKGRKITARGNALGLNDIMNLFAPRSIIVQGDEFAWGNNNNMLLAEKIDEKNIQYSIINKQCKSWEMEALKGRKITARGNALGLNDIMNPIAPRLNISQGDEFAWGNNNNMRLADRNRLAHSNNEYRNKEEKPGLRLSKVEETLSDLGKSDSQKNDNSICQRTDAKFAIVILKHKNNNENSFFFFVSPFGGNPEGKGGYNIYLN